MTPYARAIGVQLPPEAQATFAYEYQRYAKDPTLALVFTIVLGIVGGESYYFGEWKRGVLMSLAFFTGIGLIVTVPMWIVRCFTIQNECDAYNDEMAYYVACRYWRQPADVPAPPQSAPTAAVKYARPPISGVPMTR